MNLILDSLFPEPIEESVRLSNVAKKLGVLFAAHKCNEITLHAVIGFQTEDGSDQAFVKYTRPASCEGDVMLKLLQYQGQLCIPTLYYADNHWIVTRYIDNHFSYLSDSERFMKTALDRLYHIQAYNPENITIEREDRLERYLDEAKLDRIDRWIGEQRVVPAEELCADMKTIADIRREAQTILAEIGRLELVLSHGDYQPCNILCVCDGACYVVDWADCAFRPKYLDIAWLLQGLEAAYDMLPKVSWNFWLSFKDRQGLEDIPYFIYRVLSGLKYASNIVAYEEHILVFLRHLSLISSYWARYKDSA